MFNRRRCYCMNNNYSNQSCNTQNDILETKCNSVACYVEDMDSCDCGFDEEMSVFPDNPSLAQSYVPIQYMDKTFKPCV